MCLQLSERGHLVVQAGSVGTRKTAQAWHAVGSKGPNEKRVAAIRGFRV